MMKFAKFKKLLSAEEAIELLSELTQEKVSKETFSSLIMDEFLNPIIGNDDVIVGFTSEDAEKIVDGEEGKTALISYIGIPGISSTAYALGSDTFKFAISLDTNNEPLFFASVAPDPISSGKSLKQAYNITELESLDPFLRKNQGFLNYEIRRIADIANDPAKMATLEDISGRRLRADDMYGMRYVSEICCIPGGYYSDSRPGDQDHPYHPSTEEDRPSNKLLIGALLEILTDSSPRRMNQEALAAEIEERFKGVRGLKPTTTKTIFAEANKALREARKAAD